MASAFWWASHMVARLLSTKLSPFSFWEAPFLEGWGSVGWDLAVAMDVLFFFHPWWFLREDTTSSNKARCQGGDPGSLCSL